MKKRILVLSVILALVGVLVMPTAVSAVTTTTVTGTYPATTVSIAAPGATSLGTLPYNATTAKQKVGAASSDGSVTVTDLYGRSYELTVTGGTTKLTKDATALNNPLMIATGEADDDPALGTPSTASLVTDGDYSATDAAKFIAVTGAAQTIDTASTLEAITLKIYVYQKIDAAETHPAGDYTLTLTYASSVNE